MDELRARHEPLTFDATYCEACGQSYPCDFIRADDERRRLLAVVEAARPIALLSDSDVRDYEQGACFFCGATPEVVPGPRGGVTGERKRRYTHESSCSYVALRAALDEVKP